MVTCRSYHVLLVFAYCDTLFPMALRECRVTFRDVRDIQHSVSIHAETTMDAAALGLKRIREQQFVLEDLADPVTVELVTSTQHKVSLKKVMEWMAALSRRREPEGDRDEGAGAGGLMRRGPGSSVPDAASGKCSQLLATALAMERQSTLAEVVEPSVGGPVL